jgi:hypothetical protein
MNIYDSIELDEERQLPPPPRVPREHKPTIRTIPNPNWVENEIGITYCLVHGIYWPTKSNALACSGCAQERDAEAMLGTPSHASPDMRKEVRVTDPETGGQKGSKLETLGFVDPLALLELARVAGFGAKKYAPFNYLRGFVWSLSYNALQRHILLFMSGEDRDSESGRLHMAHAAWHCLALLSFSIRQLGTDDRPPQCDKEP